jgi:hypothetical protein
MKGWIILLFILAFQLGSCTAMAGNVEPWPAMLVAVVLIIALKLWNDRSKVLGFPMEFLLFSTVIMIVVNLTRLYLIPLPF